MMVANSPKPVVSPTAEHSSTELLTCNPCHATPNPTTIAPSITGSHSGGAQSSSGSAGKSKKKIGKIDAHFDVHRIVAHMKAALEGIPAEIRQQSTRYCTENTAVSRLVSEDPESFSTDYEGISLTYEQQVSHLISLRREFIHRLARPLLQKLIQHAKNSNIFNSPVDPEAMGLVGYREKVPRPMDLGTIKTRLQTGQWYEDIESVFDDIRLVFNNAIAFNGRQHFVGQVAVEMLQEFEHDVTVLEEKLAKEKDREKEKETPHYNLPHAGRGRSQSLSLTANQIQQQQQTSLPHRCHQCEGSLCLLCGEKCLRLESPVLFCSSTHCNQKIRRGSIYYITSDGMIMWCQKCYSSLPSVIRDPSSGKFQSKQHLKSTLLRRKFEEDTHPMESWIKCRQCKYRFHEVCALHCHYLSVRQSWNNDDATKDGCGDKSFVCGLCHLVNAQPTKAIFSQLLFPSPSKPLITNQSPRTMISRSMRSNSCSGAIGSPNLEVSPSSLKPIPLIRQVSALVDNGINMEIESDSSSIAVTTDDAVAATGSPTQTATVIPRVVEEETSSDALITKHNTLMRPVEASTWKASTLPTTGLSDFLERAVKDLLQSKGYESAVRDSITIRVVSSVMKTMDIPSAIYTNLAPCPSKMEYKQKCVLLFQCIDGIDVCLFCLYVHEFDSSCPPPNQSLAYIYYLDSVDYLRPASARSLVYQEIVTGYLAWMKARGFARCHFWACPPQRGDNFIFWCHPSHQRTPSRERLNNWYNAILARCKVLGLLQPMNSGHGSSNADQHQFATYFARYLATNGNGSNGGVNGGAINGAQSSRLAQKRALEAMQQQLLGAANGEAVVPEKANKKNKKYNSKKDRAAKAMRTAENSSSISDGVSTMVDEEQKIAVVTVEDATVTTTTSPTMEVAASIAMDVTDQSEDAPNATIATTPSASLAPLSLPPMIVQSQMPVCPPVFEGDFWVLEYLRLHRIVIQRNRFTSDQQTTVNQKKCKDIIKTLISKPLSLPFRIPVDPVALQIPTYLNVIKQPMDLGTVKEKLRLNSAYKTMLDFVKDIRLTFDNAMVFNPPNHPIHQAAHSLLKDLEKVVAEYAMHHQALVLSNLGGSTTSSGGKGFSVDDILSELKLCSDSVTGKKGSSIPRSSSSLSLSTSAESESEKLDNVDAPSLPIPEVSEVLAMEVEGEDHKEKVEVQPSMVVSPLILTTSNADVPDNLPHTSDDVASVSSSIAGVTPSTSAQQHQLPRRDSEMSLQSFCENNNNGTQINTEGQSANEGRLSITVTNSYDPQQDVEATMSPMLMSPGDDTPSGKSTILPPTTTYSLMQDIAKAVQRMNDDLFLVNFASPNGIATAEINDATSSQDKVDTSSAPTAPAAPVPRKRGRLPLPPEQKKENAKYLSMTSMVPKEGLSEQAKALLAVLIPDTSDPDPLQSSPLLDSRHTFLETCQHRHYQFDTLRRAKHSSLMLLYHLHRPLDPATRPRCQLCQQAITDLRWSCTECPQGFDVCGDCKDERMPPEVPTSNSSSNNGTVSSVSSVSSEGDHRMKLSGKSTSLHHHPHALIPFRVTFV